LVVDNPDEVELILAQGLAKGIGSLADVRMEMMR
jgi:hypothetical protein